MKCVVIGDVHIKVSNVPESEEMTKKLVELCKEREPNFIVLLGDVLDRHSTIHVHCLMRCEQLVLSLSKIAPTFLLVGNHDRPNNSNFLTDEHPFNAMKLWDNVYVVDQPLDVSIRFPRTNETIFDCVNKDNNNNNDTNKGEKFIFVPYVSPGRFSEALERIQDPYQNTRCFFAHQEFYGAKMGAIVSKEGDKWDLRNPLTVSGHVHDYDLLQPNLIYTGTPLMHGFGDKSDKTVSLFTFNSDGWEQERIDLGLIKKITVYITPEQLPNYEKPEDKLVKLVVKGDEASIKASAKIEKVQQLKKEGVKVVFKAVYKNDSGKATLSEKITYQNRLLREIEKDKEMKYWYNKIF